ncbi:dienelactone hydrolase family protein [Novosphingopyxis sp.]|uniref:dienelactone hydrolase family protein n=1 Tax=Novosphingopyxis sp. TaxID=2709690 RepID=UPI003B5BCFC6
MCERDDLARTGRAGRFDWSPNRRQFAALGSMAALAACATGTTGMAADALLSEGSVSVATADGTMDAFFVRPSSGKHPAILMWPDIAGLRDAFKVMARRLAGQGYAVLVANQYYRSSKAPQFSDFADFQANDGFAKAGEMRKALTPDAVMRDATSAIGWLDARGEVDTAKGVGTNGYCMGGPFTVFTAAAVPARVRAAASLHGGGLVKPDDPLSPHKLLGRTQASYLFAIGQNDDEKDPEAKTALRAAAAEANRPAEVEVYPADHGWTVIDSPSYEQAAAERAWGRMSALYERAL